MSIQPQNGLMQSLTRDDLRMAVRGETAESRANAVQKIGRAIRAQSLTQSDRNFAEKILDLICRDVSDLVRRALAVTLQNSPNLPLSIALRLIKDVDSIAVPILANSPVLTDEDLVDVLRSRAAAKVKAVAQRSTLSATISSIIISQGDGQAVAHLAVNDHAIISAQSAQHMAEIYADDDLIREAALSRQDMPISVVRKLISITAQKARQSLEKVEGLNNADVKDIASRTHERALLAYTDRSWPEKHLSLYIKTLHEDRVLGEDLILRAAGQGDMRFVQLALAQLCQIGAAKAGVMMFDRGPLGLKALCQRAKLPDNSYQFLNAALVIYRDFQVAGRQVSATKIQTLMLERILTLPIELPESLEIAFSEKLDSLTHIRLV
ncbi:MAG: DUF2336 domain-containing protein [Litorimonas sp.]